MLDLVLNNAVKIHIVLFYWTLLHVLIIHIYAHCFLITRRLHSSKHHMHIEEKKKGKCVVQSRQEVTFLQVTSSPTPKIFAIISLYSTQLPCFAREARKYLVFTDSSEDRQRRMEFNIS